MDPYILTSYLRSDHRNSTGILPTGNTVFFYETYFSDIHGFNDKFREVAGYSGQNVSNIAAISIDGMFSPYSTAFINSDFPHFEVPTNLTEPNSLTLNPFNPNNSLYTSSGTFSASGWAHSGHNIMMASVGTGLGNIVVTGVGGVASGNRNNPVSLVFDADFLDRGMVERSSIRPVGLRTPQVFTGWGFDTDGNPVPVHPSDPTRFHPSSQLDPRLWKSGPFDARWDNDRKVWTGGTQVKIYLVKTTNVINPACFSYEVERSEGRSQYTRPSLTAKAYNSGNFPSTGIWDPEYLAYSGNSNNSGCFERLNFGGVEYPYWECTILRETNLDPNPAALFYNTFTEDYMDVGHISNPYTSAGNHGQSATNRKALIENPLRMNFDVGDLAFAVKTGRSKRVFGGFSGGNGVAGSGQFQTTAAGNIYYNVTNGGSGYPGAFAVYTKPAVGVNLSVTSGVITNANIVGNSGGFLASQTYPTTIMSIDATSVYESLPILWVIQKEQKMVNVVSFVDGANGVLQSCTRKITTDYSTCEHCGESSSLVNNFL